MLSPVLFLIAAILPSSMDDWKRTGTVPVEIEYPNVAKEFGLTESDAATYANGPKIFTLAVHKLKDVTGAVAFEQSLQAPGKKIFRHQNYVFETIAGTAPRGAIDAFFFPTLKVDRSAPPTLLGGFPRKGRSAGSERMILGPESLRAFEPRLPVAAAGFDFAAEVQIAKYGNSTLAVLHYPNHAIARQQFEALKQVPNSAINRSGPIVSLILPAGLDAKNAQELVGQIEYKATIMMDKAPEKSEGDPVNFLLGVFKLAGILLTMCLVLGIIFAVLRAYGRHWSGKKDDDSMTTLGI